MTAIDIARKDLEDAARSRALWVATGIFVVLLAVTVSLPALVMDSSDVDLGVAFLHGPATELVLPMFAILIGYRSIVSERERGSIKFLLALPHSRLDVLAGTFIGRSTVLAIPVALGVVAAGGVITVVYGPPPLATVVSFGLVTVLAGTTYVAIAVGISAIVATRFQAISILLAGFVLAWSLWSRLLSGLQYVVTGEFTGTNPPLWVQLPTQLNPMEAYSTAVLVLLPDTPHVHFAVDDAGVVAEQGVSTTVPETAFYDLWFVLLVLVVWIVVFGVGSYLRFRAVDLA